MIRTHVDSALPGTGTTPARPTMTQTSRGFLHYLGGAIVAPRRTFTELADDPHAVRRGFEAVLLIGLLYTLTVAGLAYSKSPTFAPPAIALPHETYYVYETFFALLVLVLAWILAAGVAHLLARPLSGKGTFETTLATLAFAFTLGNVVTWVVETTGTVLDLAGIVSTAEWVRISSEPGFWNVFSQAYLWVAMVWMLVLAVVAVWQAEKVRLWQGVICGLAAFATFMAAMFVFIR